MSGPLGARSWFKWALEIAECKCFNYSQRMKSSWVKLRCNKTCKTSLTGDWSIGWHLFGSTRWTGTTFWFPARWRNNEITAVIIDWQVVSVSRSQKSVFSWGVTAHDEEGTGDIPTLCGFHRANYQQLCSEGAVVRKWGHTAIPHACMYFRVLSPSA